MEPPTGRKMAVIAAGASDALQAVPSYWAVLAPILGKTSKCREALHIEY